MKTIVIAWGNTLRGDDGVALRVASLLPPSTAVLTAQQLQPELAEALRGVDRVIFVDATHEGTPGEIRCVSVEPRDTDANLTHRLDPSTLLAFASKLYGAHPEALQITVCGERFDLHERLSPAVAAAVPRVVAMIRDFRDSPES